LLITFLINNKQQLKRSEDCSRSW